MKKKLLGLGVCALALGAFAGAVSAQRALEVKAESKTLYLDVSTNWKDAGAKFALYSWGGGQDAGFVKPTAEVKTNVYSFAIDSSRTGFKFLRYNPEVAEPSFDDGVKWNETADLSFVEGKDLFKLTDWSNGSWDVYDASVYEYRLVGLGGFDYEHSIASETITNTDKFKKTNLALKAGDKFKISLVNVTEELVPWTEDYGYSALKDNGQTDAKDNFDKDGDDNIVVKEGKGGSYNIYLNGEGKIFIFEYQEPDVPAEDGFYLCGNGAFSGANEKAWKYSGAKKMSAPSDPLSTDQAVLLNVSIKVGDAVRARAYDEGTDTWLNHGATYDFADLDGENYVFKKAGLYNFFVNAEGVLHIAGQGAGPIAEDGFIWLSTGDYGMGFDLYLYTWKGEDKDKVEGNGAFPGGLVSEIVGASVSDKLNFNEAGGIWKVPASALLDGGKFIVSAIKDEVKHQTANLDAAADIYVNVEQEAEAVTSTSIAKEAVVAFEAAFAVNAATNNSVCAVNSVTANTIVGYYDALNNDHDIVDEATLYTYAGSVDDFDDPEIVYDNIKLSAIILQLRAIAQQQNQTLLWNTKIESSNNTPLIITLIALGGAAVLGASIFFATRKKHN